VFSLTASGSKLALHEIRVELRNVEFSTVFAPLEEGVDSPLTSQHTIIRLTRSSGEQLALDIAGAQFGFKDALMPWDCFERRVARALPHMANGTVNEAVEAQVWNPMLPVTDNVRRTCAFYGRLTNDFDVGMSAWNQVSCFQRSGLKLPQEEHEQFGQRLCDAVRMQVEFSVDKVNPSWQEVLTRVDQESMKFQRDLPLFRAADLLRKMSYVQREVGYDQPITKVQEENGFLNIHLGDFDKLPTTVPGGALYPGLQKILCTLPEQDRDTVLSLGMCHDAICNLHLMITWLLKGKSRNLPVGCQKQELTSSQISAPEPNWSLSKSETSKGWSRPSTLMALRAQTKAPYRTPSSRSAAEAERFTVWISRAHSMAGRMRSGSGVGLSKHAPTRGLC